jgi:TPR repeat protein
MREPYPVINDVPIPKRGSDMTMLKGRGAFENYNAHYVPVVPIDPKDPTCAFYYPCYQEPPVYDEVVVFKDSQTVLRYWVVLQVALPGSVEQLTQKTFISNATLLSLVAGLLAEPAVHSHNQLAAFLGKKIGQLFSLNPVENLSVQHEALYKDLCEIIDTQKKLNMFVVQRLLQSPPPSPQKTITGAMSSLKLTSSSLDDLYAEAKRSEAGQGVPQDLKQAFSMYEALAEKGYAPALVDSARCLVYGRGTLINLTQAAERVEHALHLKLSEEQEAEALWIQGLLYDEGYVKEGKTTPDKALAERCYQKAWLQGHLLGGFRLGVLYADQKRQTEATQLFKEVVPRLQKRASKGDPLAQIALGVCYYNGQGVPQDFKQAVFWTQKAADQGVADAQFNLGVCYEKGRGVPQDFKKAAHWFQKAADQGHASACATTAARACLKTSAKPSTGTNKPLIKAMRMLEMP